MKTIMTLMIAMMIIFASCKKSNTTPQPVAQQQQNNNSTATSTTLTATESQLAGKWYYEKYEIVSNDVVASTFVYTTTPSYNTVDFKCTLSAASTTVNPYKDMQKVQNGAIFNNLVWKINDVGILSMNLNGTDPKATLDSLTTTRLVYTQYSSLQPLNGTRYYLHK